MSATIFLSDPHRFRHTTPRTITAGERADRVLDRVSSGCGYRPGFVALRHRRCLYVCMTALADSRITTPHPDSRPPSRGRLLVSVMEAAEILSVGRSSIYQLIWAEQLTPIHIGRSVRISIDQLEDFVAQRLAASRGDR